MKLRLSGDPVWVTKVEPEQLAKEDDCDAIIQFHSCGIKIRDDAEGAGEARILCHEIVHHRLAWSGMSAILKSHDDSGQLEEAMCDCLGSMLYEVVGDNPELVAKLEKIRNDGR